MKDWFKFRLAWLQAIGMFELEEAGRLFLAVINYAATREEPALSGPEMAVFTVIAQVLREDAELSEKRAVCGALGGRPKRVKESKKKQSFSGENTDEKQSFPGKKQSFSDENTDEKQSFPGKKQSFSDENTDEKQSFSGENTDEKQSFQVLSEAPESLRIKGLDSIPEIQSGEDPTDACTDTYIDTSIDTYHTHIYRENRNDSKKRFVVPTVEEVAAYCRERGNSVDAQRFVDFYTSKGWRIGKEPMRDWKACVRTWERNGRDRVEVSGTGGGKPAKTVAAQQYSQRDYSDEDEEAFQRMLVNTRKEGY